MRVCKCESQKPLNIWDKGIGACKRSGYKTGGKNEFRVSYKWLETFRKRHLLVFNKVFGEAGNVCEETVADRVTNLHPVMDGYDSD